MYDVQLDVDSRDYLMAGDKLRVVRYGRFARMVQAEKVAMW